MAHANHTPRLAKTEEALTILFCLIDDAYALLNPHAQHYESIKRLSDSEVIALALFQQLRGVESERSFLRDAQRFFSHLFPGVVGGSLPFLLQPAGEEAQLLPGWSLCGGRSSPSLSASRRPCSSIRRCWMFCIRARFLSRQAGEAFRQEPHG